METLVVGIELDLPQSEVEGVADSLTSGLGDASKGLAELGKQSTASTRAITGLASAVSLVDPRLGQVTRSIGTFARGTAALKLGLGPAVVLIGALTTALHLHQQQQEEVGRRREQATRLTDALAAAERRLLSAQENLAVATGELSEQEAKVLQIRRQAFAESLPAVQELTKQITEQSLRFQEAQNNLENLNEKQRNFGQLQELAIRGVQEEGNALTQLEEKRTTLVETLRKTVNAEIGAVEATEQSKRATKAAREEEKRRAEDLRELEKMHKTVAQIEADASQSIESSSDRIIRVYEERIEALDEIDRKTQGTADTDAARTASLVAMEQQLRDLRAESIAVLEQRAEKAHREEMARIEEQRALRLDTLGNVANSIGMISDLVMESARREEAVDKAGAERKFKRAKRLALAEAVVQAARGTLEATAAYISNPFALAAALITVGATVATQVAAIQGATLHAGGFGMAPDEYRAPDGSTRLREERVISPTGSRQEEQVRQIERGSSSPPVVVMQSYKHFGRFSRDELRRQGPLSMAFARTGRRIGPGRY